LTKRLRVLAAGQQAEFSFDVLGRTRVSMGWIPLTWSFTANSTTTTLQFQSLDTTGGYSGPMLDNVRVLGTSSGPACSYTVSPTVQSLSSDGGSSTINVVVAAGCVWTATTNVSWITINSGASGVGVGTVTFLVAPNSTGSPRAGSITIAGQNVAVMQTTIPGACIYNVSPWGVSVPADGTTSGWIAVSTTSNCGWSATTNVNWITITSGASGAGNGSVSFTVAPNPGPARSAAINAAGQVVTVNQESRCTYSLAPSTSSTPAAGTASGSITVTTASICTWTATTAVPWILITSGASGTGNGTVSYIVAANTGAARTATITVASQTHTVTQAAGAGLLPAINAGGIVSAADYSANLAPGGIFSLFGSNLASATRGAASTPLPTSLEGVSVEVLDGARVLAAPLFFISPGQINAQMPFDITSSSVQVRVRNATGQSGPQAVNLLPRAPRLFTKTLDGKGEAILVHASYAAVSAAVPAIPAETVILYLTGLGMVSPSIAAGQAGGDGGLGGPLNYVSEDVTVTVDGRPAKVSFAGLAPYFVGLYQINFQVPEATAPGMPAIKVRAAQQESQAGVTFACGAR
jgi:uncharacterized protein (TIGR03437 family)